MPERAAALIRTLSRFESFNHDEHVAIGPLLGEVAEIPANTELFGEGQRCKRAYMVIDGWAFCYKDLSDGGRQIINFQLSGDFLGLRNMLASRPSDYSFATLTRCRLVQIKPPEWERLLRAQPKIGTAVFTALAKEEAMISEHLVNLGRRSADQRTAHLLCELGHRLEVNGNRFNCPIPQSHLSDALGLSVVHLNRTLRKLRECGFIAVGGRGVQVTDFRGLAEFAGFDNSYLGE